MAEMLIYQRLILFRYTKLNHCAELNNILVNVTQET